MASIPFYSYQVREGLVDIISNTLGADREFDVDANDDESSSNVHRRGAASGLSHGTTAIRGKWSGGYASSSSSDEDTGVNNADSIDDDASSSSSASSSSMEAIREEDESKIMSPSNDVFAKVNTNRNNNKNKKRPKGKNSKKEEKLSKLGKAPSILLPYHKHTNNTDGMPRNTRPKEKIVSTSNNKVLEIPSILLPNNYLRNHPDWNASSVAHLLLDSWDQLAATTSNDGEETSNAHPTIIVVLLQSGRFAACTFSLQPPNSNHRGDENSKHKQKEPILKMIAHKTSTRYTVRRGQGGSQSSNDQSKGKAKSIGAQLRREGERQLRDDARATWKEWKSLGYVDRARYVFVSCPKNMRREYLFGGEDPVSSVALVDKKDERIRSIPLDVGRPTMEAACAVVDCVLNCCVREMTEEEANEVALKQKADGLQMVKDDSELGTRGKKSAGKEIDDARDEDKTNLDDAVSVVKESEAPPLTPLHEAVINGDLTRLMELLKLLEETEERQEEQQNNATTIATTSVSRIEYDINTTAGPDHQTPLHMASSSNQPNAPEILSVLLLHGHANPTHIDARGRPPYFLAASDKHRETYRLARGTLGESYCSWDDDAKVGPPITPSDLQQKKAKAAEKKRRQRARQKEKRANEKANAERMAAAQREEEERAKAEEDAKRIRRGLQPKSSKATNACDFCQKIVKGKKRSQMFQRLEYAYCSTDCVKRHQRELMAAAATARLGG